MTTLAWDIGIEVAKIITFLGEVIVNWKNDNPINGSYGGGYDHSYCLVFQKVR